MTIQHHSINYVELKTRDIGAAKRFYAAVFGWSFIDYGPTYAAITGAGLDGGLEQSDTGGAGADAAADEAATLVVLYSADLDATLAAVTAAGGEIIKPTFSFPGGRRFHFRDPGGSHMAVWSQ